MRTFINWKRLMGITLLAAVTMAPLCQAVADDDNKLKGPIRHVLLISIDGMHALDLENCIKVRAGLLTEGLF